MPNSPPAVEINNEISLPVAEITLELDSILPESVNLPKSGHKVKHVLDFAKRREEYENLYLQNRKNWEEIGQGFTLAFKKTDEAINSCFRLANVCIGLSMILFALLIALAISILVRYIH